MVYFKSQITAGNATFAPGMFDSKLEKPSGRSIHQNAWLTLTLRVHLNFVDPPGHGAPRVVNVGGKSFAADHGGWLFPILPWTPAAKRPFVRHFKEAGRLWNHNFALYTPKHYAGLDIRNHDRPVLFGKRIRCNVLCLFDLKLVKASDSPHQTINLYNIDPSVTSVKHKDTGASQTVTANQFRSDAANYDSFDLAPAHTATVFDNTCKCMTPIHQNTILHEVGHSLAQPHIAGLQGDPTCAYGAPTQGQPHCYVSGRRNVMGNGNDFWPINAYSWKQRIAEHTKTQPGDWWAQMAGAATHNPQLIDV